MTAILIDIGRYKIRIGLMNEDGAILDNVDELTQHFDEKLLSSDKSKKGDEIFSEAIKTIAERNWKISIDDRVRVAIAAPGPFHGDEFVPMAIGKSGGWNLSVSGLRTNLTAQTYVVHDVIAGVLSIAQLRAGDAKLLHGQCDFVSEEQNESVVYIQTGVGLGVSALVPGSGGRKIPFSSEAGSTMIAPQWNDEDELKIYEQLAKDVSPDWGYTTAQYILCNSTLGEYYKILGGKREIDPADLFKEAIRSDNIALRALEAYAGFLGSFAGNMALAFRAYGGVYIGGFLPAKMVSNSKSYRAQRMVEKFRTRFSDRGKQNLQLKTVPVWAVTDEYNALLGLRTVLQSVGDA